MGIVVALTMLLGLIVLRPTPWNGEHRVQQGLRLITFTVSCLTLIGSWNVFWYGLRHLESFWGWAAIVSGITMILSALIIFKERSDPLSHAESWLSAIRGGVVLTLALSFLLYAVTIIQLNMGLPILR